MDKEIGVMSKKIPLRMCLGCRCMKPKSELLRIVKPAEGDVTFDETGKMPGRGAYVCKNAKCFADALKKNAISRALGVSISDDTKKSLLDAFEILAASNTLGAKQ